MDHTSSPADPNEGKRPRELALGDPLYLLAYGQVGLGCLSIWGLFLSSPSLDTQIGYVIVGALVLVALPCVAGVLLLKGRAEGITCTRVLQLLQLIQFGSGNLQFGFVSGLGVFVGFKGPWLGANFSLGGSFSLLFRGGDHPDTPLSFAVNFVPIVFLWLLAQSRPSLSTLSRRRAA